MAGQSQSWRNLTLQAQMFIGLIVTAGTAVLLYGAIHQSSKNIAEFICYLGIAVLASRMKVNLPGITGTMSVNFLFVLLGVLELSFSETLILGCVSILVQSLYPDRPNAIQVTFNVCAGALSTALAYFVYHHPFFNLLVDSRPLLLGVAACTYFVANTGSIATVISLTEGKRLNEDYGGLLFLVVSLLPGGRRNCRGELAGSIRPSTGRHLYCWCRRSM